MSNLEELYKRQLIWTAYQTGRSNKQSCKNFNVMLGSDSILQKMFVQWYPRFKFDNISLFEKDSKQDGIIQAIQKLPNGEEKNFAESLFLASNEISNNLKIVDGRFAIFSDRRFDLKHTIVFVDLFHDETKEVEIAPQLDYNEIHSLEIIGDHHLLMETSNGLVLLKVNYETWEVSVVANPDHGVEHLYNILVDQSDPRKVLIYDSNAFVTGSLVGDEIVFSPRREFNIGNLCCAKLVNNKLCGLRWVGRNIHISWQYRKIDLTTLTEENIDVPFALNTRFYGIDFKDNYRSRSEKRFYFVSQDKRNQRYIFAFDSETLTWKNTGIAIYGRICSLFVDQNEILTLQVTNPPYTSKKTFYRFALKKPDSLKNLAWLTIRRSSVLFNSNLYDKIRSRLPYGRGLRSLFISDFE